MSNEPTNKPESGGATPEGIETTLARIVQIAGELEAPARDYLARAASFAGKPRQEGGKNMQRILSWLHRQLDQVLLPLSHTRDHLTDELDSWAKEDEEWMKPGIWVGRLPEALTEEERV